MRTTWAAIALAVSAAAWGCAADSGTGGSSGASGFGGAAGGAAVGGSAGFGAVGGASGSGGFAAIGGAGGAGAVGGASGAGGAGGNSCAMGMASAARVTPSVMLVLDGSCSMSTEYPGDGTPDTIACTQSATNRWTALRNALIDPTNGVVARMQSVVKFGLAVYGTVSPSGMQCPLVLGRIEPALDNLQAITNGLPPVPPGLNTPTPQALNAVFQSLPDQTQVLDMDLGPQIVLLATDGAPNGCDLGSTFAPPTQAESLQAAMTGVAKGIRMFVVSLAAPSNTALQQHLQQMANVGLGMDAASGSAQLFAPTDPSALSTALEQIIGGALGCEVGLNGNVTQGMECSGSTVELNSIALGCNDPNGWRLVAPNRIELMGLACDEFKANTASIVRADFPCNIFVPD